MKKKILIALNEKIEINIKNEIEIISKDIQYREGIIEILEFNKEINYILFSENLLGQISIKNLIEEIFNINKNIIVYILVKRKKQFIKENKNILNNKNIKIVGNLEDEKLNYILNSNEVIENNKINNKIISISGTSGVGKSITTLKIAKYLEKRNKKILIIELDYLNKSIKLITGVRGENKKINSKIDYIEYNNKIDILNIIELNKENYDYILIDISSESFLNLAEKILKLSDINIFLIEPNLLGIKKSNTLLNIYIEEWNIEIKKIFILFNKYNKYSIKYEIIKKIFYKFKIIGKIKINEKYDLVINKNKLNYLLINKSKYKKIINRFNKKINKIKGDKILWKLD